MEELLLGNTLVGSVDNTLNNTAASQVVGTVDITLSATMDNNLEGTAVIVDLTVVNNSGELLRGNGGQQVGRNTY